MKGITFQLSLRSIILAVALLGWNLATAITIVHQSSVVHVCRFHISQSAHVLPEHQISSTTGIIISNQRRGFDSGLEYIFVSNDGTTEVGSDSYGSPRQRSGAS